MDKLQLPNPAAKDKWQELIPLHPRYLPPTLFDVGVVDTHMTPDEKAVDMATLHDAKYPGTNPRTTFVSRLTQEDAASTHMFILVPRHK
jgi:hypothetical protein